MGVTRSSSSPVLLCALAFSYRVTERYGQIQRRLEPVVILRNDHMIIALRATSLVFNYPSKECKQATADVCVQRLH